MKKVIFILSLMLVAYIYNVGNVRVFAQLDNRGIGENIRDIDPTNDPRTARDNPPNCSHCAPNPTDIQPLPTSGGGGAGGVPTQPPSSGGGSSNEDACASGKSYTGPYCGWSPEKDQPSSGGGGETTAVLGLSATSSSDLTLSDIMLLTGVLCLLLYVRSKVSTVRSL